jgi:hypothetical protein
MKSNYSVDWKDVIGAVAPTIATALGGPLAGAAVKTLSNVLLGHENGSESDLSAAIGTASPDTLAQIKKAEADFQVRMRELEIDVDRISAADRDSARKRESSTGDFWTPRVIGGLTLLAFIWSVWAVLSGYVQGLTDPAIVGIIGTLIGYVSAKADQVVSYYFGSSSGSRDKTQAMSDALSKVGQK